MRQVNRWPLYLALMLILAMMALTGFNTASSASPAKGRDGDSKPPPIDFSDDYYRANGINPDAIRERVGNPDRNPAHWIVDNSNTDPTRRDIRVLETTGGFNNSGSLIYYSIMGTAFDGGVDATGNPLPHTFQTDANGNLTPAGQHARDLAMHFRAFLFPKASAGSILSPAPPNRRQDNVFDTRDGYFSNNPLGLWILAFVVYTPKAFTPEGTAVLDPIAANNGRDLDGTPILTDASTIDNLAAQGLVEIRHRPLDGSQGFPWVI